MDVLALLNVCKAQDIQLTIADGTLHCDAPTGALTESLRVAIAQHKPALLALLTNPPDVLTEPAADTPRHPAVHDPRCEGTGLTVTPGVGWDCPTCQQRYRVPTVPSGVLHLWSEILQDDVYGSDSQATAREVWATHRLAVYTPGELRRLRQLERADPHGFAHKVQELHRLKKTFGGTIDAVMIPPPHEQEISAADGGSDLHREGGK